MSDALQVPEWAVGKVVQSLCYSKIGFIVAFTDGGEIRVGVTEDGELIVEETEAGDE